MASNLHWRPVGTGESLEAAPDKLKLILRDKWGMAGESDPLRLNSGVIPFLEGLDAARVDGAKKLIKLIQKYDEIYLYEAN